MPENDHSKNAQMEEKLVGLLLGELNAEEKRMVEELCVKDVAWAKRRGEL